MALCATAKRLKREGGRVMRKREKEELKRKRKKGRTVLVRSGEP
jgi:hypothetical protein